MAQASHKEILQREHLVEHVQVLRKELEIVQSGLTQATKESALLIESNAALRAENIRLAEDNEAIRIHSKLVWEAADTAARQALEAETKAKQSHGELVSKIASLAEEHSTAHVRHHEHLRSHSEIKEANHNEIAILTSERLALQDAIEVGNLTIQKNNVTIQTQQDELESIKQKKLEELSHVEGLISQAKTDLVIAQEAVDAEKAKIAEPLKFLKAEETRLKRLRSDIDIYAARTRAAYNKAYPDREMKL